MRLRGAFFDVVFLMKITTSIILQWCYDERVHGKVGG